MRDLVSIITPLYNCETFIAATIESVLAQTYENWEMLIVDDKSSDNSLQIARLYAKQEKRIKITELDKNSGAAIARNTAIKSANGRYIAFLDSDDLWMEDKLEIQIKYMVEKDISFTYTAYDKMDENGNFRGRISVPTRVTYDDLLNTNSIGCLTAIYDVKRLGKMYMPNIKRRQDYALWLKLLKVEEQAFGLDIPLAGYRVRNNSISSNKLRATLYQWRVYRDIEQLNLFKSIYHLINYSYYGFKKYRI